MRKGAYNHFVDEITLEEIHSRKAFRDIPASVWGLLALLVALFIIVGIFNN